MILVIGDITFCLNLKKTTTVFKDMFRHAYAIFSLMENE